MTSRYKFDFGNIDRDKVKRRFETRTYNRKRLKTTCGNFDSYIKGFPFGLTLVFGKSGSGKSALMNRLALTWARQGYKVVYVFTESGTNLPKFPQGHPMKEYNENVFGMNYTKYRPYYKRVSDETTPRILAEILCGVEMKDADVCIIDSFTTLISSNKAIDEADMRDAAMSMAKASERNLPVIGISQVRGQGQWMYPAGGQGVLHSTQMTLRMDKKQIMAPWEAETYGTQKGRYSYIMSVENDVEGKAAQDHEMVVYHGLDYTVNLKSIEDIRKESQDQIRRD